jgi:hypothetical protein
MIQPEGVITTIAGMSATRISARRYRAVTLVTGVKASEQIDAH